jgi:hypothetical protein
VSDNNPYAEALFRTTKYRPAFPANRFVSLDEARNWGGRWAHWHLNQSIEVGLSVAGGALVYPRRRLTAIAPSLRFSNAYGHRAKNGKVVVNEQSSH